jgi:hypothetical protein
MQSLAIHSLPLQREHSRLGFLAADIRVLTTLKVPPSPQVSHLLSVQSIRYLAQGRGERASDLLTANRHRQTWAIGIGRP